MGGTKKAVRTLIRQSPGALTFERGWSVKIGLSKVKADYQFGESFILSILS